MPGGKEQTTQRIDRRGFLKASGGAVICAFGAALGIPAAVDLFKVHGEISKHDKCQLDWTPQTGSRFSCFNDAPQRLIDQQTNDLKKLALAVPPLIVGTCLSIDGAKALLDNSSSSSACPNGKS